MTTAFARLALSPILADDVDAVLAESQIVASLEVRPWREVQTPAQEDARSEHAREAEATARAIILRERRGEAVRPPFRGALQALRAYDEHTLDGPAVPGIGDRLDMHHTGRAERASGAVERLADVIAAWEQCLADGWTITTAPALVTLSGVQARAVVVWSALGWPGSFIAQQDQRGLLREAWRPALDKRHPPHRLPGRGGWERIDDGAGRWHYGDWLQHVEPEAPAVAEYASEQLGVSVPVGHVVRLRREGVLELYGRLVSRGLVPHDRRLATMADTTEATGLERLDLHGWKAIAPLLGKGPDGQERSVKTLRQWAERADDPLPLHTVGGQVAACREDLAAWSARELERTRRRPKTAEGCR